VATSGQLVLEDGVSGEVGEDPALCLIAIGRLGPAAAAATRFSFSVAALLLGPLIGKNLACVHPKLDQSWRWGVRADGRPSGGWIYSSTAWGGMRLYQGWSPYRRKMATAANAQAATLEAGASLLHAGGLPSEG